MSANPKIEFAMTMPSSEILFWKSALRKYVHIYAYRHICEKLFFKTQSMNLALALEAHFFNGAYCALEKSFIYILHVYLNIYRYFSFEKYNKTCS